MGGTGSGRWTYHDKKTTVEDCWAIGISQVIRALDFQNPEPASGFVRPTGSAKSKRMNPIHCTLEIGDDDTQRLALSYKVPGRWGPEYRVEEAVGLRTTRPNYGGVRWWFSCPRAIDGKGCGRRVGKLYRAPGRRRFACRRCLDLTYESCQRSHRYDGLFAVVAGEVSGETFEAVKRAFYYQAEEGKRRRATSSPTLLDAFNEVFGSVEDR
jgi:hypothetical protein